MSLPFIGCFNRRCHLVGVWGLELEGRHPTYIHRESVAVGHAVAERGRGTLLLGVVGATYPCCCRFLGCVCAAVQSPTRRFGTFVHTCVGSSVWCLLVWRLLATGGSHFSILALFVSMPRFSAQEAQAHARTPRSKKAGITGWLPSLFPRQTALLSPSTFGLATPHHDISHGSSCPVLPVAACLAAASWSPACRSTRA